jgi:hypothetical protein
MASLVLIEANGTIKTLKTKEISNDSLYKKCGFRVSDDFLNRHTWRVKIGAELYIVSLWGKKTGKANFENKYDLPPPLDHDLYFGTCAIVRTSETGDILNLEKETWLKIYEKLFGGFEDIGDDDEYSDDELANVDPALLTAHGYLKDDFVVSDKEALESDETSTPPMTPAPVPDLKKKAKRAPPKKAGKKTATAAAAAAEESDPDIEEAGSDTTSELEEEAYIFSDED